LYGNVQIYKMENTCHRTSMHQFFLQNWIFVLCPFIDVAAQNTLRQ